MSSRATAGERANPGVLPQPLFNICLALFGLGVVAFVGGVMSDPQTAWLAFHTNFIFFTMLACGGIVLTATYTLVSAEWPGPYRRFAESFAAFLPVALVLGCIGIFGGEYLFDWQKNGAMHGKEAWLNKGRFYGMSIGLLALMSLLGFLFIKASVRPTLRNLAEHGEGMAKTLAASWTAGWRGDEEERVAAKNRTSFLAPMVALTFGFGFAFFSFDQVMSMEQAWFSNLFGNFVCWGGILSAVAASAISGLASRSIPGFQGEITRNRQLDVGKMIFAFSIFWMYLFWSQYLVIYYGNLPEETFFIRDRLGDQFMIDKGYTAEAFAKSWRNWDFEWSRLQTGYGWVSMLVWTCNWLIPFWVFLGREPKVTPWIAGPVAGTLLFGLWLERNLLIWPSVVKGDMLSWFGPIQIGIFLGFLGLFLSIVIFYSRVFPTIAVSSKE